MQRRKPMFRTSIGKNKQPDANAHGIVPASLLQPGALTQIFQECMELACLPPPPPPLPPPPEQELKAESSGASDIQSDEDDDHLTRLFQVLPDLVSPGGRSLPSHLYLTPSTMPHPQVSTLHQDAILSPPPSHDLSNDRKYHSSSNSILEPSAMQLSVTPKSISAMTPVHTQRSLQRNLIVTGAQSPSLLSPVRRDQPPGTSSRSGSGRLNVEVPTSAFGSPMASPARQLLQQSPSHPFQRIHSLHPPVRMSSVKLSSEEYVTLDHTPAREGLQASERKFEEVRALAEYVSVYPGPFKPLIRPGQEDPVLSNSPLNSPTASGLLGRMSSSPIMTRSSFQPPTSTSQNNLSPSKSTPQLLYPPAASSISLGSASPPILSSSPRHLAMSLPLLPTQRMFLELQDSARKLQKKLQAQVDKTSAKAKQKKASALAAAPSLKGTEVLGGDNSTLTAAALGQQQGAGEASVPSSPPAVKKKKSGPKPKKEHQDDAVSAHTEEGEKVFRFRSRRVVLDQSVDMPSDTTMVRNFLEAAAKRAAARKAAANGAPAPIIPATAKKQDKKDSKDKPGKPGAKDAKTALAQSEASKVKHPAGISLYKPVPGSYTADWPSAAHTSLDTRVAAEQSKLWAAQSAIQALAPLKYKSRLPISGVVKPAAPPPRTAPPTTTITTTTILRPSASFRTVSSDSDDVRSNCSNIIPVEYNAMGVPRLLGLPPDAGSDPSKVSILPTGSSGTRAHFYRPSGKDAFSAYRRAREVVSDSNRLLASRPDLMSRSTGLRSDMSTPSQHATRSLHPNTISNDSALMLAQPPALPNPDDDNAAADLICGKTNAAPPSTTSAQHESNEAGEEYEEYYADGEEVTGVSQRMVMDTAGNTMPADPAVDEGGPAGGGNRVQQGDETKAPFAMLQSLEVSGTILKPLQQSELLPASARALPRTRFAGPEVQEVRLKLWRKRIRQLERMDSGEQAGGDDDDMDGWMTVNVAGNMLRIPEPSVKWKLMRDRVKEVREHLARAQLVGEDHNLGPLGVGPGPTDRAGEVGRLMRRYQKGDPAVFILTSALRGINQVSALADLLVQLPQLQALYLASNDITDTVFEALANVLLKAEMSELLELDLGRNKLSSCSLSKIMPLLTGPPDLKTPWPYANLSVLLLSGNTQLGDISVQLLANAIKRAWCKIKELDLSRCSLGERSAIAMGDALMSTSCLEILDMSWNSFGVRGAKYFAAGVKLASCLHELNLAWTGIQDEGSSHILQAMVNNSSIILLDLSGNGVSINACTVLTELMLENKTLVNLVLRDNSMGQAAARRVIRALLLKPQSGPLEKVDLYGCSFQKDVALPEDVKEGPVLSFNPHEPDGTYSLNLAMPSERQIALELLEIASQQGLQTWTSATLDGKKFKLLSISKQMIPESGQLQVTFQCAFPILTNDAPLTDAQFNMMWRDQMQTPPKSPRAHDSQAAQRTILRYSASITPPPSPSERLSQQIPGTAYTAGAHSPESSRQGSPNTQRHSLPALPAGSGTPSNIISLATSGRTSSSGALPRFRSMAESQQYSGDQFVMNSSFATISASPFLADIREQSSEQYDGPGGYRGSRVASSQQRDVPDHWKMGMMLAMLDQCFMTCEQVSEVALSFTEPHMGSESVVRAFGILSDPENLHQLFEDLSSNQVQDIRSKLGALCYFNPANPTGVYSLFLSQPAHRCVARRLLLSYVQQCDAGLCFYPYHVCFTHCAVEGMALDVYDPHHLILPKEGLLRLHFVDLRPIPPEAQPLSIVQFQVLIALLIAEEKLDPIKLVEAIDDPSISASHEFLSRYHYHSTSSTAAHSLQKQRTMKSLRCRNSQSGIPSSSVGLGASKGFNSRGAGSNDGPGSFRPSSFHRSVSITSASALLHPTPPSDASFLPEHHSTSGVTVASSLMTRHSMPQPSSSYSQNMTFGSSNHNTNSNTARHQASGQSSLRPTASSHVMISAGHQQQQQHHGGALAGPDGSYQTAHRPPSAISSRPTSASMTTSRPYSSTPKLLQPLQERATGSSSRPLSSLSLGLLTENAAMPASHGSATASATAAAHLGQSVTQLTAAREQVAANVSRGITPGGRKKMFSGRTRSGRLSLPVCLLTGALIPPSGTPGEFNVEGYVDALRQLAPDPNLIKVRDQTGLVEALRMLTVKHYITCEQLIEILELVCHSGSIALGSALNPAGGAPATPQSTTGAITTQSLNTGGAVAAAHSTQSGVGSSSAAAVITIESLCVEVVTLFWARTVDRANQGGQGLGWTDVVRKLDMEGQVMISQRLGYFQVFNHLRPGLHYRLRMFRPDEHEIAWQLFNISMHAQHQCFDGIYVDGKLKKVNQGPTMWTFMRGNCPDGSIPEVTVEFYFSWPEAAHSDPRMLAALKDDINMIKEQRAAADAPQTIEDMHEELGEGSVTNDCGA
ncbi:hypothetical protein CEUSTIGMA_g8509.t1 [Chlamydomonas eustigma]|uniref:Uncharacterized protein n=1 Tax=Chlamydomonas eustigma TaxID=1157962 RepID=A0A250XDB4_9CHLO|nr:hypothetical protein CEUSTIGMA_g8509.t1 [Chlamydomonas eustigma]|eukprot:GAX81074.1 hypothetical protein CEUSTIGMA_g8509.t1 [Chlamydomonas eustigma]